MQNRFEYFDRQRNFALSQCSYEWVVCLDADERITPALKKEIECQLQDSPKCNAFIASRKSRFTNKWILHSDWYPDYRHLVFFNKNKMRYKDSDGV